MSNMPALDSARLPVPNFSATPVPESAGPPRVALLAGSARPGSFSQLMCAEVGHLVRHLGGEARMFDPTGLPLPNSVPPDHPKVKELRELLQWSDAQFWCSPENFGTISAVFKAQLEWVDGLHYFQGKPLAVAQVCAAVHTFNTATTLATVGRWIGMIVTPTQLCVAKVQEEFDGEGRMKRSPHYDRLVDLAEELFKLAALLRPHRAVLGDRYSTRGQG